MPNHRALTADERLAELQRDRKRLRKERMVREIAGPVWGRMMGIVPALFRLQGRLVTRVLRAPREDAIHALGQDAVFAVDTAMRLMHGAGFLTGGDVHAYVTTQEPIDRLAEAGLVDVTPCLDTTLVRPWPGPPRLLACVVGEVPAWRVARGGERVVDAARLRRELFVLLERLEAGVGG